MSSQPTGPAFVLLLMLSFSVGADPQSLVFSHVVSPDTPKGKMATMFKSIVERKLGNRFRVVIHPNAELMDDDEAIDAISKGRIHFAAPSVSKFDTYTKQLKVFDLPFLFSDIEAVERFQNGPVGQSLLESMKPRGIVGLGYLHNGLKQLSASKPFRVPSDLEGLSFRIMNSDVLDKQFRTIGAIPVPMAFSEVYDALANNLIQGQENTWSNIYSKRFYEHQPYIMESNHGVLDYMIITSDDFLESLDKSERRQIEFAMRMAVRYGNAVAMAKSINDRDELRMMNGVKVFRPTGKEVDIWRDSMKPLWKEYELIIGKDVIKAAYNS